MRSKNAVEWLIFCEMTFTIRLFFVKRQLRVLEKYKDFMGTGPEILIVKSPKSQELKRGEVTLFQVS